MVDESPAASQAKAARDDLQRFMGWYAAGSAGPCVAELRALKVSRRYGKPGAEAGYFDLADPADRAALAGVVESYTARPAADQPRGVYLTVNPVDPRLKARAGGRVTAEAVSCSDADVPRRLTLLVDVDPVRPSGIGATDAEKAGARAVFDAVLADLDARGWPAPLVQDSGNGYQGGFRIDLPAADEGLVERCLKALAAKHDTPAAHIDTSVHNSSRIGKLPGTWARKGDDTPDRPHRVAAVLTVPDEVRVTPRELVEELAAAAPAPPAPPRRDAGKAAAGGGGGRYGSRLVVTKYLDAYGVGHRVKDRPDAKGRTVYVLDACPFDPSHADPDACVMQAADGMLSARCLHKSCSGRGWQEFKAKIGPPARDHYDPPLPESPKVFMGGGPPPPAGGGPVPAGATGAEIIAAHFRERYRPVFRRGDAVVTPEGETVPRGVACAGASPGLIERLGHAADAPRVGNTPVVKTDRLPGFFRNWAPTAWIALRDALPEEEDAELGADSPAGEEFRRLVREALFAEVTLADNSDRDRPAVIERMSVAWWCHRFAKAGPWRDVRGKPVWCKVVSPTPGEMQLRIALRHELFAQLGADRRLREMGPKRFARLARKYAVGESGGKLCRPHGQDCVALFGDFVNDLFAGEGDLNATDLQAIG